jgi:tRNA (guanine-N7-)-methyltransferase
LLRQGEYILSPVRVRQHVNPLAQKYQTVVKSLEWEKVYVQPHQPLHLDIGSAKGRFLLNMAKIEPSWNFLGLEIREPLVIEANKLCLDLGLTNLHYLFCNVNKSLNSLLSSLPTGTLQRVTIQFPDPWFKTRHAKRRMVQPELVSDLANYLAVGGVVFLQSDIESLALEMRNNFAQNSAFQKLSSQEWMAENPLPVATERENATKNKGEPIYRTLFIKRKITE